MGLWGVGAVVLAVGLVITAWRLQWFDSWLPAAAQPAVAAPAAAPVPVPVPGNPIP
ncbi:hypothetical protein D3C85_1885640 [compost metagenome]